MKGTWYICTDASRLMGRLLEGERYRAITGGEVFSQGKIQPCIVVRCTDGKERWYPLTRFVSELSLGRPKSLK